MPLTPQITLSITLNDIQGVQIGSAGNPAYVEIALASFGPTLPRIAGTSMIASVGPQTQRLPYVGATLTGIKLWGNDVITPAGTYYVISLLDDDLNVLQSAAYVFNGTIAADLSTLPQFFPSAASNVRGAEVVLQPTATPTFDCGLVNGPIEFDFQLTRDVTTSTLLPNYAGQIVVFRIVQDVTGNRAFVWPTNVLNPGMINPAANSTTVQAFFVASDGNAYPLGPQTWN